MLEIKNLNKNFDNKKVLKNINFKIDSGDILGIIGPSGCGKSTLLRCINLLEKPTSGQIIFEDKNIINDNKILTELRKKIGMVFQQFNLFDHMNVLENIIFAPVKLKLMNKEDAIKKAKNLLKSIDLEDIIYSYPHKLSGGQKQRVAIIRTLIMNPKIILFDEPTSALDPEMTQEVINLMKKIANEEITMIVVSHEMSIIKGLCNKVIFMNDGKIIEEAQTKEIFENPKDERLKKFLSKLNDN